MFASVVIDVSSSNVDYEYEYEIPQELEVLAQPGVRVKVPFGQANRLIMGYIISVSEQSYFEGERKEIIEILDFDPVISSEQMQLAKWVKKDTFSPLIRILNLMIPKTMRLKTTKYLVVKNFNELDGSLALALEGNEKIVWNETLKPFSYAIQKAIKAGHLEVHYDAKETGKEKKITKYIVNKTLFRQNSLFLNERYQTLLSNLINLEKPQTSLDLLELGFTHYLIRKLKKEGYLKTIEEKVSRIKDRTLTIDFNMGNNEEKETEIVKQMLTGERDILWTPSSENEEMAILLNLVKNSLQAKHNIFIFCPDILSSYRYASFLSVETKMDVACLNSDRSDSEIFDYYKGIINDEYQIIVTTSIGALFPYQNIKTVVLMDIENDNYKNDQSPRYHLKYIMKERAKAWDAKLIYHSLAPDLQTYSESLLKQNLIIKTENNLYYDPKISIIDMTDELLNGNRSPFSRQLTKSLMTHYENHKQALLILNNQGYSQFLICRACGEVIRCPKCNIPMRYHKEPNAIVCPTCNHKQNFEGVCPKCGSSFIRHIGFGMEKLAETVKEVLPDARITIINSSNYHDFEEKQEEILNHDVDIILASEIFSHSVANANLTLVGILALDIVANSPLYDAHHRAYSLLEHAKLKATVKSGELIVQTYNSQANFLTSFVKDDYFEYFKKELKLREALKVEPIFQVNRLLIKGPFGELFKIAVNIKKTLHHIIKTNIVVVGPAYNKKDRAVQLIIKHQSKEIFKVYENLYKTFQNEKITLIFDKYPKYIT